MFDTIFDLPVHPLVVHATVVALPAAALAVGLAAVLPRFRRWAGLLPLALASAALVLVPVTTRSGEELRERLGGGGDLVARHAGLGEALLPWVLVLFVGALLLQVADRRARRAAGAPPSGGARALAVAAVVLSLIGALGTVVQVALVGHSGAQAVWSGVVASTDGDSDLL